jgi:hypothetical protein
VERVIEKLVMMGFTVHKSTGVTHTVLGGVGRRASSTRWSLRFWTG